MALQQGEEWVRVQFDVRQTAKMLGLSEQKVHRLIESGELPARRVLGRWHVGRAELLEWVVARNLPMPHDLVGEGAEDEAPPSLSAAMRAGGIHYDVAAADKIAALREAVIRLPLPKSVDVTTVLDILIAREALGSTGLGEGIAAPHMRNPMVLNVVHPVVGLCFLAKPVDFGALDGRPVDVLFTLVTPSIRAHLQLLARLSAMLQDAGFKAAVRGRAKPEDILVAAESIESAWGSGPRT